MNPNPLIPILEEVRRFLDGLKRDELAHLLEMNHSRRFWEHVARWCPDHRDHRRWLKDHGRDLQNRVFILSNPRR